MTIVSKEQVRCGGGERGWTDESMDDRPTDGHDILRRSINGVKKGEKKFQLRFLNNSYVETECA